MAESFLNVLQYFLAYSRGDVSGGRHRAQSTESHRGRFGVHHRPDRQAAQRVPDLFLRLIHQR